VRHRHHLFHRVERQQESRIPNTCTITIPIRNDTEAATSTWKDLRDGMEGRKQVGLGFGLIGLVGVQQLVVRDFILWRAVRGEGTGMVVT